MWIRTEKNSSVKCNVLAHADPADDNSGVPQADQSVGEDVAGEMLSPVMRPAIFS
jgi:hypothetical protein